MLLFTGALFTGTAINWLSIYPHSSIDSKDLFTLFANLFVVIVVAYLFT